MSEPIDMETFNLTACEDFLSICLKDILKGYQFNAMKCLLEKDSGGGEKLLKMSLLVLLENALNNKEKQEKLKEMILTTEIECFNPLIFGNCPLLTKFIVSNISPDSDNFFIAFNPTDLKISLSGATLYYQYENGLPIDKMLEIIPILMENQLINASFWINRSMPGTFELYRRILAVGRRHLSYLEPVTGTFATHIILQFCRYF